MTMDKINSIVSKMLAAVMLLGSAAMPVSAANNTAPSFLNGRKAVQLYSGTAYFGAGRTALSHPVLMRNETALLSEPDFEALFGVNVSRLGTAVTIGSGVKMTVGSEVYTYNGTSYKLSAVPETAEGVLYLPIDEYGKNVFSSGYITDGHGMVVTGTSSGSYNELRDSDLYLFFERKEPTELKTQFLASTSNGAKHPRLIADSADFARIATEIKKDKVKAEWYSQVLYTANSILKEPVVEYQISDGRLLDVANSALSRLQYLGFAYQVTKNTKYAERGIRELEAICGFSDWHPAHYLDTGTLASAAAIGYDWLYEAMTDEQRKSIAQKAQLLALDTARQAYEGRANFNTFWVNTETNWGIVCNGGIANLALATGEYNTDSAMEVLAYALRAIEYPWYRFAPDGAWYEGTDYWSYLLTHLSLFMSGYESVMGEAFGKDFMGLDKYAYFQVHVMGPDGLPNNFHDADESVMQSDGQFYLADLYNDTLLMSYRIGFMKKYSIKPTAMDLIWCQAGLTGDMSAVGINEDMYFRETELVSMRSGWDEDAAWVSFHGGYSDNAHDHIDPGTFVYNIGGVRWAVDLGKEPLSYVEDSKNPSILAGYNSYYFYRRKGEGHNIVVINPDANLEIDQFAFAKVSKPVSGSDGSYSTVDLSDAYAKNASSYIRGCKLSDDKRTLTVRDEIKLNKGSELHWYMHTRGMVEIVDNNTAIITQGGKKLLMRFITNADTSLLGVSAAEPLPASPRFTNTANTGVTKLDYKINAGGDVNITVKMSLIGEAGSSSGADDTPIAQWSADKTDNTAGMYIPANKGSFSNYSYMLKQEQALGGRPESDKAYSVMVSGADAVTSAEPGFEIPFYSFYKNSTGKIRTLELSVRYSSANPYTVLKSYISANASSWSANRIVEFVRFENGKVYVNGKDTGITAKGGEWFHIVVEEHYNASDTRVIINGTEYNPGLTDYIFGNRWTQLSTGVSAGGTAKLTVSDIACYEGSYVANGSDKVSYTVYNRMLSFDDVKRTLTVTGNISVDELRTDIVTDGSVNVVNSLEENMAVSGNVSDGDVLVMSSEDGKSYAYYTINIASVVTEPPSEQEIKLLIDNEKSDVLHNGVLRAEFTVGDVSGSDKEGMLILAVYKNGVPISVQTDTKAVTAGEYFSAEYTITDTDGISVKAMFWDENMKPYVNCISCNQ